MLPLFERSAYARQCQDNAEMRPNGGSPKTDPAIIDIKYQLLIVLYHYFALKRRCASVAV
jgi:hypothetical protein